MRRSQWVKHRRWTPMGDRRERKLHQQRQAVYGAEGKWQAAIVEAEQNRPKLRIVPSA